HHKNLDGAQSSHARAQFKILEIAANGIFQHVIDLVITHSGNLDVADSGQVNRAGAVHQGRVIINAHLAPGADEQLIARPKQVIRRYRDLVQRRKSRRNVLEKAFAKNGEPVSERIAYEFLELGVRF